MDLSKVLHGFVTKLLHGLVKVVLCLSRRLLNKTKLKFDRDFKACWSFCCELKLLNGSKYSMPCVHCAFGNVFPSYSYFSLCTVLMWWFIGSLNWTGIFFSLFFLRVSSFPVWLCRFFLSWFSHTQNIQFF